MADTLSHLEPRAIWRHFAALAAIPRPSKHEARAVAWVRSIAREHGWDVDADTVGNLVVRVPATSGREGAPVVVLQGHLDIVCEKNNDVSHDFMKDPIRPRIDGDWVCATGTTLGADNGIGVAAALAAATDPGVAHGPLELLLTLDEETGLTGAKGLDGALLRGRILLNLDSEEDGVLSVGCAGGADTHLFVEPRWRASAAPGCWRVAMTGLRGGHSGLNILENRGSALKLLVRLLVSAVEAGIPLELADLTGGSKHNAIPREAHALVFLDPGDRERFEALADEARERFGAELAGVDDGLRLTVEPAQAAGRVLEDADRDRLLGLLSVLPHGVLGMSREIAGLVETSSNLASVTRSNGRFRVVTSSRSSVDSRVHSVVMSIRAAGKLAGIQVETHDGYPAWTPQMSSPVLALTREVFAELWGRQPQVTAIHAGLECGLLGEKVPGMDMISFGPQIEGAHSPDERVQIASVARFWEALRLLLDRLARDGRPSA